MWTYEPRQGRNAATVVCSTFAVVTLALVFSDGAGLNVLQEFLTAAHSRFLTLLVLLLVIVIDLQA